MGGLNKSMSTNELEERDRIFLRLFLKSSPTDVSEEELDYFRAHPEQIDQVTAPVNIHKLFLWAGALIGLCIVGLSKALKFIPDLTAIPEGMREFGIDILFESGVALIGAAITAYILGILLDRQQENAAHWRAEIRRRLSEAPE
jgi:hypothetical protein